MGNQLATCCGSEEDRRKPGIEFKTPHGYKKRKSFEQSSFYTELVRGVKIRITLGDYSRLACDLHFSDRDNEPALFIACDVNGERRVRRLPISSISAVLSANKDLASLEAAAGVQPQDECVALRLDGEGGCLPLFFPDRSLKERFVAFISSFQ